MCNVLHFVPDDMSLMQMSLTSSIQKLELQGLPAVFDLEIFTHIDVNTEELYVWNCTHKVSFENYLRENRLPNSVMQ